MPKGNKELIRLTKRVVASFTDAILIGVFYSLEFATSGHKGANYWEASRKAEKDLDKFNHETIARALRYIKRKGLIQVVKEGVKEVKITEAGRSRLASLLPHYDSKRAWDGILYLVTYDIPVKHNRDRDLLRTFLKKIGCGMLQESLWLTPYNPKKLIGGFVEDRGLHGTIFVSHMGKDGSIGEIELPELLESVYRLSEINGRYIEFIGEYDAGEHSRSEILFAFLSILQDDPQLPFELLPEDWQGDRAYRIFRRLLANKH